MQKERKSNNSNAGKKTSNSCCQYNACFCIDLTQATTALSLGDGSGNTALLRRYKQEGLSPTQWGGNVEFTGLQGPFLLSGWKRQEDDLEDMFLQIERKFIIVKLVPPGGFSIGMIELICVDKTTKKLLKLLLIPWLTCLV